MRRGSVIASFEGDEKVNVKAVNNVRAQQAAFTFDEALGPHIIVASGLNRNAIRNRIQVALDLIHH